MAVHRGAVVMYVTNNGAVPAVTSVHYDVGGDPVDDTAANAVTVDLTILAWANSKLTGVAKSGTAGTLANVNAHTAGTYYVPS